MDGPSLKNPSASGQCHKSLELKGYSLPDLSGKVTKAPGLSGLFSLSGLFGSSG
jgi:hypothetical protein